MPRTLSLFVTGSAQCVADPVARVQETDAPPVSEQLRDPKSADVTVVGSALEPAQLEPTPERIARLSLPPGFEIAIFAEDLVRPRMPAAAEDGSVYVTRREVGDVVMLRDEAGTTAPKSGGRWRGGR